MAIDHAALRYLGQSCYVDDLHPHQGNVVVSALCYVWPDMANRLPFSWRACKGWTKLAIMEEGRPVADQRFAVMEDELWLRDSPTASQVGDAIVIAVDGYLREQDLFQLRVGDVIFNCGVVTLLLGVGARGESTKTGRNQGVVLDEPLSYTLLKKRCKNRKPHEKVFDRLTPLNYSQWWKWAARKACGSSSGAGKPHSARHTGPSRDLTLGYRSMETIMKRGRWKALTSIHRYAKPHAWYACLADLSAEERARGDAILAARAPRPAVART